MKSLFIGILFMFNSLAYCQWVEHIIPQGGMGSNFPAEIVKLSDLNGNGLHDIVYSKQTQGIYWFKNLGSGNFNPQELIIDPIAGEAARYFDTGDLNNNGFTDIVLAYFSTNGGVYWHENLDGLGTFGVGIPLQIPSGAQSLFTKIADIDGDGKLDVIVTLKFQTQVTRVMWFKNLGSGQFDAGTIIVQDNDFPQQFEIGDIDGDGDLDIVIGSTTLNRLSWFENIDGQGSFSGPKPIGSSDASNLRLQLGDINGNGFLDIVADFGMVEDRSLVWFENLEGLGNYSEAKNLVSNINIIWGPFIIDVDNDGDMDIISTDLGELLWLENLDGLGDFGDPIVIKESATWHPSIYDVNEDGNIDVVLFCGNLLSFCWLENRVLSTQSFTRFQVTVVPNPAKEKIQIAANQPIDKIELNTVLGQKFLYEGSKHKEQTLKLDHFKPGLYFVSIYSGNEKEVVKVVKK